MSGKVYHGLERKLRENSRKYQLIKHFHSAGQTILIILALNCKLIPKQPKKYRTIIKLNDFEHRLN